MTTETATEKPAPGSKGHLLTEMVGGRELPAGYDSWAYRTVAPDFRSRNNYRYPFPGGLAEAPGPINTDNLNACPAGEGDGICAAATWAGMASAGRPATTILLVAYSTADVLGDQGGGKVRLRRMLVVDVVDGARFVIEHGRDANLRGANLCGANLGGVNLRGADLGGVNLRDANLCGANLSGANLCGADLGGVNLRGADLGGVNLRGANLWGANLGGANLYGVDLCGADLGGANLRGANLRGADLGGVNLYGANLYGADLGGANLRDAYATTRTSWPTGFDHTAAGVVTQ